MMMMTPMMMVMAMLMMMVVTILPKDAVLSREAARLLPDTAIIWKRLNISDSTGACSPAV